jgi:arginyl-tRNA synthetase
LRRQGGNRYPVTPEADSVSSPHLFAQVLARVQAACAALTVDGGLPTGIDLARVAVEPTREASHGEIATNAAMVLAREAKAKPRDLAEQIARRLRADDLMAAAEVAGPGFINLTLKPSLWADALRAVLRGGETYGRSTVGAGEKVKVGYVGNPTGPIGFSHGRAAVLGDALASVLIFAGYDVTRQCYISDAGAQADVLARSAFLRYREALGENVAEIPEGLYPGDYLQPVGAALAAEYGASLVDLPESGWLPAVRAKATLMMMEVIRDDLAALGIRHDLFVSECSLIETGNDRVAEAFGRLRRKGGGYEGRLTPKGSRVQDCEGGVRTLLFRAYDGEDDRPLEKSDGADTCLGSEILGSEILGSEIACHKDKLDRGFLSLVEVRGPDDGGDVEQVQAAIEALTEERAGLDVRFVQRVKLWRHGEPIETSKRRRDVATLRKVVDEVGCDAVRFMMLHRKSDGVLDFDLAKAIEQSKDNAVFYVQYGHALGHSVLRSAREAVAGLPETAAGQVEFFSDAPLERLEDPAERGLMRRLALYPRIIEAGASTLDPNRIAIYLYDLASDFHALWKRGGDLPHLRFIINNDARITKARLAMVQGVVSVLASGLAVLGIRAPDEVR